MEQKENKNILNTIKLRYQYPIFSEEANCFSILEFAPNEISHMKDIEIDLQREIRLKDWKTENNLNDDLLESVNFYFDELNTSQNNNEFIRGITRMNGGRNRSYRELNDNMILRIVDFELILNDNLVFGENQETFEDLILKFNNKYGKSVMGVKFGSELLNNQESTILAFSNYQEKNRIENTNLISLEMDKLITHLAKFSDYCAMDKEEKENLDPKSIPATPTFKQVLLFNLFAALREVDYKFLNKNFGGMFVLFAEEIIPFSI